MDFAIEGKDSPAAGSSAAADGLATSSLSPAWPADLVAHDTAEAYLEECTGGGLGVRVSPKLRIGGEGDARGLFAAEPIAAGDELVVVPFGSLLTMRTPFVAVLPEALEQAALLKAVVPALGREDDVLALRLLFEMHAHGAASKWAPHLRALPREMPEDSLLRWTQDEMADLAGTSLYPTAVAWRSQVKTDFDELATLPIRVPGGGQDTSRSGGASVGASGGASVGASGGASWGSEADADAAAGSSVPLQSLLPWLTRPRYEWALSMVWSRFVSVDFPSGKAGRPLKSLAPCFDLCNHRWYAGSTHLDDAAAGGVVLSAGRAWEEGAEMCITYGKVPNTQMLLL